MSNKIELNKVAGIHYKLVDADTKELLDESKANVLEFLVGKKNIIPGLESELMGLKVGDSKDVSVKASDAYGEYDKSLIEDVPADQFSGIELEEGMTLYAKDENDQTRAVVVKTFDDKNVTIDYNHPLAGKSLLFSVTVANVRDASAKELEAGFPQMADGGCCGGGGCSDESGSEGGCCSTQEPDDGQCCSTDESNKNGGCCNS